MFGCKKNKNIPNFEKAPDLSLEGSVLGTAAQEAVDDNLERNQLGLYAEM